MFNKLNIDLSSLEIYDYIKIDSNPIELLNCLKILIQMKANELNLNLIKIITFQILMNMNNNNNDYEIILKLIITCLFNIYKYQFHHKDSLKFINLKNNFILKILLKLFENCDEIQFYKNYNLLLKITCEYIKILINNLSSKSNSSSKSNNFNKFQQKYSKHAFIQIFIKERINFPISKKYSSINCFLKKNLNLNIQSLKLFIKKLFKLIKFFKPNLNGNFNNKIQFNYNYYKSYQYFIQSSLIIINDVELLKFFKNLKIDWIDKSWADK